MKKFLLVTMMIVSVCSFAANNKPVFRWKNMKESDILFLLNDSNYERKYNLVPLAFELESRKDATLLTDYNKFSSKIEELCNKYNCNKDIDYNKGRIIVGKENFSKEIITNFYNQHAKENTKTSKVVAIHFIKFANVMGISYDEIFDNMLLNTTITNSTRVLKLLKKYQFKIKEENLKKHLKKLNRIVYPHIGEKEEYKKIAVEIQLMLKSLE